MKVINVGSGPNMININKWDTTGITIVGANNVWKGTDKWDHLICAGDYPEIHNVKVNRNQQVHSRNMGKSFKDSYAGMANMPFHEARYFLGLPMYFGAAYWSLYWLKPKHLGFIGFDMNYKPKEDGSTTFYGVGHDIKTRGIPDPLYQLKEIYKDENMMDILFSRLEERKVNCKLWNLSDEPESLLPWERITFEEFRSL